MTKKYKIIMVVGVFLWFVLGFAYLIDDANETVKPIDYKAVLERNRLNSSKNTNNPETEEINALANTDVLENLTNTSDNTPVDSGYNENTIQEDVTNTNTNSNSVTEAPSNNHVEVHNDTTEKTVWIGETGTKYHYSNCRTLRGNKYEITLQEALNQGREPCKVCNP